MPHDDVEKLERHRPGWYHPTATGKRLHSRYDIVHKLDFGTYSTTWLPRDWKTMKYVAVKIVIAAGDLQESETLRLLGLAATVTKATRRRHRHRHRRPGEAVITPSVG